MPKLKVGLYGTNGHQITRHLLPHPDAEIVAVAAFKPDALPAECADVARYDTLDAMLAGSDAELVSLCSPFRRDQAADAVKCMKAGRHVYAEKPCALTEPDLDAIIETAKSTGVQFHEQAGTAQQQPYMALRKVVQAGRVGAVVQVYAQKCYPWGEWRPADEAVDGGLSTQAGIYVARFVEFIAGQKIASLELRETKLGNDFPGSQCRRAASMLMTLESGGVASGVCNYLNAVREKCWGYEILRIFGTDGIVESNMLEKQARLLPNGGEPEDLDVSSPTINYFDLFARALRGGEPMEFSVEQELSPTRWVIRAKNREQ